MSSRRELGEGRRETALGAFALALVATTVWVPFAAPPGLVCAAAGAIAGTYLGRRLAASTLRGHLPLLASPFLMAIILAMHKELALRPTPAVGFEPEWIAGLTDAALLGLLSAAAASLVAFYAHRVLALRPLPAALLIFALATLLAAHRGGAIHLPAALSDLAWVHGWHPALVLALAGSLGGFLACIVLYRPGRSRLPLLQVALVLLLALVLLGLVPSLSIFHFSPEDPLGLSGGKRENIEKGRVNAARSGGSGAERGDVDPLRLGEHGEGGSTQEQLPFRDEYDTSQSQVPIAVVILHDDIQPSSGIFYFRQVAFSAFNGRRLVQAFLPGVDADIFDRFPVVGSVRVPRPPGKKHRAELLTTVALLREHAHPFVLTDGYEIDAAPTADPALFRRSYDSHSLVWVGDPLELLGRRAGHPNWSSKQQALYLETPHDPRYAEIAKEALALLHPRYRDDPYAKALAVAMWLQQNTSYSTRSKHASASDPTASYLFGDRIGYCVHLAHAGVYLMRILGLPARVAAGYAYIAEQRAGGSALMLRSGDAHAWAEVYIEGAGWLPIDPSPPSLDPPLPETDLDLQRLLGELARADNTKLKGEASSRWRIPTLWELAVFLLSAFAAWAALGLTIKTWRRIVPRLVTRDPRARLAMRANLDRLADLGQLREAGETREAFAARVATLAPSFVELTREHLAANFGKHTVGHEDLARLHREIARELGANHRWIRRLGVLSPWRWTRTQ